MAFAIDYSKVEGLRTECSDATCGVAIWASSERIRLAHMGQPVPIDNPFREGRSLSDLLGGDHSYRSNSEALAAIYSYCSRMGMSRKETVGLLAESDLA